MARARHWQAWRLSVEVKLTYSDLAIETGLALGVWFFFASDYARSRERSDRSRHLLGVDIKIPGSHDVQPPCG